MSPGWRRAVMALALAGLLAAGPALAREPVELIKAIYSKPNLTFEPARSAAYYARDLEVALKQDSSNPGEVGAVDFDFRYGAQDAEITGLQFVPDIDGDQARVVAVFKNFGKANSVDWTLCRRSNGDWRIVDAGSNTGREEWDLRRMLNLPVDRARC